MTPGMRIDVESYAGYKGDERPLRFRAGGPWLHVVDVIEQWYSPGAAWFRVRAGDGCRYVLKRSEHDGSWTLERGPDQ